MKPKAFTLIELLVVIAIIALLMSVVVPSLRKAKESANLIICANNLNQTVKGVLAYAADNQSVLPPHPAERINGTFSVAHYLNYHQGVAGWAKNEGTYYYLGSYLPLVDTFMCPLGRTRDYAELQYQYENYKTPEKAQTARITYTGAVIPCRCSMVGTLQGRSAGAIPKPVLSCFCPTVFTIGPAWLKTGGCRISRDAVPAYSKSTTEILCMEIIARPSGSMCPPPARFPLPVGFPRKWKNCG